MTIDPVNIRTVYFNMDTVISCLPNTSLGDGVWVVRGVVVDCVVTCSIVVSSFHIESRPAVVPDCPDCGPKVDSEILTVK